LVWAILAMIKRYLLVHLKEVTRQLSTQRLQRWSHKPRWNISRSRYLTRLIHGCQTDLASLSSMSAEALFYNSCPISVGGSKTMLKRIRISSVLLRSAWWLFWTSGRSLKPSGIQSLPWRCSSQTTSESWYPLSDRIFTHQIFKILHSTSRERALSKTRLTPSIYRIACKLRSGTSQNFWIPGLSLINDCSGSLWVRIYSTRSWRKRAQEVFLASENGTIMGNHS